MRKIKCGIEVVEIKNAKNKMWKLKLYFLNL